MHIITLCPLCCTLNLNYVGLLLILTCFSFSFCWLKVVPYVWYMAAATLPAGMVGKSRLYRVLPFPPWRMWFSLRWRFILAWRVVFACFCYFMLWKGITISENWLDLNTFWNMYFPCDYLFDSMKLGYKSNCNISHWLAHSKCIKLAHKT
jgi:hypothetical protein